MFSTTGPLMPKCVQSSEPSRRIGDPAVHAQAERRRVRDTGERRVPLPVEQERRKRGRRVDVAVPETTNQVVSEHRRCRFSEASVRRSRRPRHATTSTSRVPIDELETVPSSCADPSRDGRSRWRCQAAPPRPAAHRAPCASDWCPETACRLLPRAAERRAPRRRPRHARPETRAARCARRETSHPRSRARSPRDS